MTTRGSHRLALAALAGFVLAAATGCTRDRDAVTAPNGARAAAVASSAPQPSGFFYYYQGQPVQLDVDSSAVVVASVLPAPQAAIGEALSGAPTSGIERVPQAHGHWLVHLTGLSQKAFGAAFARVRADARFTFASHVFRVHEDGSRVIPLNRLLLQPRAGVGAATVDSLARAFGMLVVSSPDPRRGYLWYTLAYPIHASPLDVAAALHGNPLVELAEPDFVGEGDLLLTPNNPYYPLQYYFKNTVYLNGVRVDDNVEAAWDLSTGSGVKVAVIDAGVDGTHPQLCGGAHTVGYDAWPGYPGEDAWHPASSVLDMHGTMVAGIIAACLNNGVGTAGIAPDVTLYAVRIIRNDNLAADGDVAAAINWAWSTAQADVLSNSWRKRDPSDVITNAINAAATQGRGGKGAAVVFAAGNTSDRDDSIIGAVTYPATLTSTLAVGAIDRNGHLTNYTPEGSRVGIVAPSGHYTGTCIGDVVTLAFYQRYNCNNGPNGDNNYTATFSGTSAAAPQVSGAAALLLARYPTLGWSDAAGRIRSNADSWGPSYQYGSGKLNIYRILVPALHSYIISSFPSFGAVPVGGVAPYSFYWEACVANCGGDAPGPPAGGGTVPNRPIQGWFFLATDQSVTWGTHNSYLRCMLTDSFSQQSQSQIYVP